MIGIMRGRNRMNVQKLNQIKLKLKVFMKVSSVQFATFLMNTRKT